MSVYLLCLGLGASLILVSLLFGGGEKDFDKDLSTDLAADHDADLDHDAEIDAHAEVEADMEVDAEADVEAEADHGGFDKEVSTSFLPFLSMRFWTFGLATFGLSGALLTLLGLTPILVALFASAVGTGLGWAMATLFRRLKSEVVTAPTALSAYRGEEARVVLPIRPGATGKIALQGPDGRVEMLARSETGTVIEAKASVVIVRVHEGIAEVAPLRSDRELATDEVPRQAARRAQETQH